MQQPYFDNIESATLANDNFRKVLWTGSHTQLVLMSLKPGEDIGTEVHPHVDQFFRIESGSATVIIAGEERQAGDDDAFIVPAGAEHNVVNTGEGDLKLYSLYSPANHIDGRVHATKADAEADLEDEAFGHGSHA
jgi:mannose-6-phosphate isomerase-like protein (cupin superfamily)